MPDQYGATERDHRLAELATRHGAKYALRIVIEAKRAGIPASLAFALVEQESNFTNVFGHDPTIFAGAGEVTRKKYLAYKAQRGTARMQGVGLTQLTWWATQDAADRVGGCWTPKAQLRVAFVTLAALIKQHGYELGVARYNGSGRAATNYSLSVRAKARRWHNVLT